MEVNISSQDHTEHSCEEQVSQLDLCIRPNGHRGFLAIFAVCFVCVAKKRVLMSPLSFNVSREEKE